MELEIFNEKEVTIKSVELVDIINQFRKLEGNRAELRHKSFMGKLRKEIETLELLGLRGGQNILLSEYTDLQGKARPCYELNRDGAIQVLNSESTLVRYKTIEYINELECENVALKEDNKELHSIAISDDELAIREYQANKVKYALRNVRNLIEEATYATLEDDVGKIIDVHEKLKAKDRYKADRRLNSTEYKNKVKKYISVRLEDVLSHTRDPLKITVGTQINVDLQKGMLETTNRSTGKLLAYRKKENVRMMMNAVDFINVLQGRNR